MPKYHINPATGNPNQCRAGKRACPFGGHGEHFSNKDDARANYEVIMAAPEENLTGLQAQMKKKFVSAQMHVKKIEPRQVQQYMTDEHKLDEIFDKLSNRGYFVNDAQREERWKSLMTEPGEHWFSNQVADFKIYNETNTFTGGFRVINYHNIKNDYINDIFTLD